MVAWAAGVAGGIARDLLIGAVPPAAIADWRYLATAVAAGLVGFFASDLIAPAEARRCCCSMPQGLCLFAVTGTQKALAYGLSPVMAAVLGMITCIGGGVARDLLTLQVPTVLARRTLCRGRPGRRRLDFAGLLAGPAALPVTLCRRRALPLSAPDVDLSGLASAHCQPSAISPLKKLTNLRLEQTRDPPAVALAGPVDER